MQTYTWALNQFDFCYKVVVELWATTKFMIKLSPLFYMYPGTYVLIISDVTDPPYQGSRLPDLFLQVRVMPQKATKEVSLDRLLRSKSKLKK